MVGPVNRIVIYGHILAAAPVFLVVCQDIRPELNPCRSTLVIAILRTVTY
jgi:hypothetical protein